MKTVSHQPRLFARCLTLVLLALPTIASACPVCFDARAEARGAFIFTTALLTFLPLMFIGGAIFWYRKRYLEAFAAQAPVVYMAPTADDREL